MCPFVLGSAYISWSFPPGSVLSPKKCTTVYVLETKAFVPPLDETVNRDLTTDRKLKVEFASKLFLRFLHHRFPNSMILVVFEESHPFLL